MEKIYPRIGARQVGTPARFGFIRRAALSPLYWLLAHSQNVPGLSLHRRMTQLGLRALLQGRMKPEFRDSLLFYPMDSVRYFEFDFIWQSLKSIDVIGKYLDVSSPRLFPAVVLDRYRDSTVTMVNPDGKDLQSTRELMHMLGLASRCTFVQSLIGEFDCPDGAFDTVTCISVVEHIPDDGDVLAIQKLWRLLSRGGRLFLTVPCAANSCEEHIDFNEYGLYQPDANNFVFGQRFYDESLLEERMFKIIGRPVRSMVFGEKRAGHFVANREERLCDPRYPHWREPYMVGENYSVFDSVRELPGWGVIAFEFVKT